MLLTGVLGARVGAPGAAERVPGAPGTRRQMPRDQTSDDSEDQGSEGWVLSYEQVHGGLERTWRATRGRLARAWRMGQVLGQPVYQRAPESRTGSAWLGLLYRQSVWSQFVCFDIFDAFRGVKNGWHSDTPCPRMLPIQVWGLPLAGQPVRRYWCGVEGGTVLSVRFIIAVRKYPSSHFKNKTNYFHKDERK